jgi:hypothetical protein
MRNSRIVLTPSSVDFPEKLPTFSNCTCLCRQVSKIITGDIESSIRRIEMSVGAHQSCSVTLQDDIGNILS